MNIHLLAADIADRVPAMAQDCKTNNCTLIEQVIQAEMDKVLSDWNKSNEVFKSQISKTMDALDSYGRTQPDIVSAACEAVNDANRFRIATFALSDVLCNLWDGGVIDHDEGCPCDDTCECKLAKLANEAYKLTGRECLA